MAKGELAFSTIVSVVLVAIVMIAVIIWFLPAFSETTSETDKVKDAAGTSANIIKIRCKNLCSEAEDMNLDDQKTSDCCDPAEACIGLLNDSRIDYEVKCA